MVITWGTLAVTIILIEAQFWIGTSRAEVSCVILSVVVPTAADAWQMAIPVPDKLIECLLCLSDKITKGFNRLPTLSLTLTLYLLGSLLFPLGFGLRGIIRYFSVTTGTVKRTYELTIASWMEPFFTY